MHNLWFHNEISSRRHIHLIYIVKTNNKAESLGPYNAGSTVFSTRDLFLFAHVIIGVQLLKNRVPNL